MSELTKSEQKIKDILDRNIRAKFTLAEISFKSRFSFEYAKAVVFDLRAGAHIASDRVLRVTRYFSNYYEEPVPPSGELVKISHASKFKSKPYRTDRAMQESIARCRELYPEGHSLSKSGHKS